MCFSRQARAINLDPDLSSRACRRASEGTDDQRQPSLARRANPVTPSSDHRPLRIVPKGLRSFDAHDADFFLELLPGPRDREGLPDSIRFWKTRIEETDAEQTFSMGLIYGPSGCGKSSLVKAGLLPRLSDKVISVYVEATAQDTETRLLNGLRKRCPLARRASEGNDDQPSLARRANGSLKDTLAALRRGQGLPPGKKVLIVLDQFEQWLHANRAGSASDGAASELVQALRQCDGAHVQCIVMVRDDFWMAATRFMRELEIVLEGGNSAAVDLFPVRHAAKVLAAYGRALGALAEPPAACKLGPELETLLDRLDGVSGRFAELREGVSKAIAVAGADPEMALTRCRQVLELVVRSVYERRVGEPAGTRPLDNLLQRIVKEEPLPHRLAAYAMAVKDLGNVATHRFGEKITTADVQQSLTQLAPIIEWYLDVEGALAPGRQAAPRKDVGAVGDPSAEQRQFVEQAVAGLAEEGKVICVRLALFAEMLKGRPWTPASLKAVGGTTGVGVTFLEETFSGKSAAPQHRYHQKPARAVLKALLPEAGSDIKGNMRSQADLLAASGYAHRPKDFEDLLRVLDSDLRLITPTDPLAGRAGDGEDENPSLARPANGDERFYQLTHDYLVPSLRDWLTRKQKETRRGRAELLLADRAGVWNARQENRQLPSLAQWLRIRWWTHRKNWTAPQRKMMRKANRYHVSRTVAAIALMVILGLGGWEVFGRVKATHFRNRVLDADIADVPGIVEDMRPYRRWLNPLLREASAQAEKEDDRRHRLRCALALLPADPDQKDYLNERLLDADPHEVLVIREALLPYQDELSEKLWSILTDPKAALDRRFHAAAALARWTPQDDHWNEVSRDVAAQLLVQDTFVLGVWAEALQPVAKDLLPPLASFLDDEQRSGPERAVIAKVYGRFAAGQSEAFAPLEKLLEEKPKENATDDEKLALVKRQANAAVALVAMGHPDNVWPLLQHTRDPSLRSFLIERMAPGGADAKLLWNRFEQEEDLSKKRALLLSLGEFGIDRLPEVERQNMLPRLKDLYRTHADPGIHGAIMWLLRTWKQDASLPAGCTVESAGWMVNSQGQTMVIVPKPGVFWMCDDQERHQHRVNHAFAIGATDVTLEQFRQFRPDHKQRFQEWNDSPAIEVSWYDAAEYCNWLSKKDGIAEKEWCYLPNKDGKGMRMAEDYLTRKGYRLPTEAEWEYACRAGSDAAYSFGQPEELLLRRGWFGGNALSKTHPVGLWRPNDLGLFDMHGNVWQWTQQAYGLFDTKEIVEDTGNPQDIKGIAENKSRVLRGGSWGYGAIDCRSAGRSVGGPGDRNVIIGFRVLRPLD